MQDGTYTPLSRPLFIYVTDERAEAAGGAGLRGVLHRQLRPSSPTTALFVPLTDAGDRDGDRPTSRGADCGRSARRPAWLQPTHSARPAGSQPAGQSRRRRWGEDASARCSWSLCASLSIVDHDRDRASRCSRPRWSSSATVSVTEFFTGTKWAPLFKPAHFGVLPLILRHAHDHGHRAALVCVPLGLGAAIYLAEYARPRVRAVLKPILEVLAGIPTVVFGYFALTFIDAAAAERRHRRRHLQRPLGRDRHRAS